MNQAVSRLSIRKDRNFFLTSKKKDLFGYSVFYKDNDNLGFRLSILVGKKTENLAVRRNALKRRIRTDVFSLVSRERNMDVLIRVRKRMAGYDPTDAQKISSLLG